MQRVRDVPEPSAIVEASFSLCISDHPIGLDASVLADALRRPAPVSSRYTCCLGRSWPACASGSRSRTARACRSTGACPAMFSWVALHSALPIRSFLITVSGRDAIAGGARRGSHVPRRGERFSSHQFPIYRIVGGDRPALTAKRFGLGRVPKWNTKMVLERAIRATYPPLGPFNNSNSSGRREGICGSRHAANRLGPGPASARHRILASRDSTLPKWRAISSHSPSGGRRFTGGAPAVSNSVWLAVGRSHRVRAAACWRHQRRAWPRWRFGHARECGAARG